jgi:eukaryotic-like serine/threonine-protein kinase
MADMLLPGLSAKGGSIAGRYRVERVLGTGPSAYVVLARHAVLRERVTLKVFARRTDLRAAHAVADVNSPHVARVVDTGFTEEGMPFVAYEHVAGDVLASLASLPLPLDEAAACMVQVSAGLAAAHAHGLVHGNLKPSNVVRAEDGTVRVLDFGARAVDETTWCSSPAYTAPEQIADSSNPTPAADVWAVGILLSWLLTGALPFHADTVAGMLVAVTFDPPSVAPGPAADLITRCLAKDPKARPSMREVEASLRTLAPRKRPTPPRPAAKEKREPEIPPAPPTRVNRRGHAPPPRARWSLKVANFRAELTRDERLLLGCAASLVVAVSLLLPADETPASTRALVEPPPLSPPESPPLCAIPARSLTREAAWLRCAGQCAWTLARA